MKWPFGKTEIKENPVGKAYLHSNSLGHEKKDKKVLAKEGYAYNVVVYRAIDEIVKGLSDITIEVKLGNELQENHPALKLLNDPNPMQGMGQFLKNIFIDYLINGEMFVAGYPLSTTKPPSELWPLNPLEMTVRPGKGGIPSAYVHMEKSDKETVFPVGAITGESDVFYMKMYNPLNYWRGLSPLEAAALAGDTHNAGMVWNYSLLNNGARPSGIVQFESSPSGEVLARLKEFFKRQIQGAKNAGEIPILTGGAKWQSVDNSPKDMDYIKTMKEMTKYIASAFGVPLPLVDNDSSSYNNMEQAKERLWTDTIIPLLDEFLDSFGKWLLPRYGENLEFCANLDSVQALEGVRTRRYNRMVDAASKGVITIDEARVAIGYDPMGGIAESLLVPSSMIPLDFSDIPDEERSLALSMQSMGYSKKEIEEAIHGKDKS
jgi:HK97 family phage portal protein